MASHKISSNDMALFLSRDGVTYSTVVCLTAFSVTRSTTEIDAKSFCGPDKLPGAQDNGVTFEGQVMENPDSGTLSTDDLTDLWLTKQTIYWKVGKLSPLVGDETDYGTGWISKLDKTGSTDTIVTFSGAIGVYGLISHTTATS